jgi:signal transduction histidine kinase
MSKADMQQYIQQLETQLSDQKRAEKLQHALFKIASIHNESTDLSSFYQEIHEIVKKLIYAKNLIIAIYDDENQCLTMPYSIDDKDIYNPESKIPLGKGLSSYVINTRKAQLLNMEKIKQLIVKGEIADVIGSTEFTSWMGSPMISTNMIHGLIIIQSYEENIIYTEEDLELLNFVAKHIAIAIEAVVNDIQRTESQLKMATQHRLLQHKNKDLHKLIEQLKSAQKELIQKEKMASLGGLVAGIAHEINTPLGICVTGVSHLQEEFKIVKKALSTNTLSEKKLVDFFDDVEEILAILSTNTQRGAALVNSFKQVAVDQTSNEVRNINLHQYIDEVILSLKPTLKRSAITLKVICDEALSINVDAGVISQILSNLIVNSVKHGFNESDEGNILIEAYRKNNNIVLRYRDDGNGIDEHAQEQLFEPFYTTKRGAGGSGLGTHLVYNLVTGSLKGKIAVKSQLGKGLAYLIKFPAL